MELDNVITGTDMTFREQIELMAGDSRVGRIGADSELDSINGGKKYAAERISFWAAWNESYMKKHGKKNMNTQRRYIEAQTASIVYASAVYKALVSLIASQILKDAKEFQNELSKNAISTLHEYMSDLMGGSLLMMQKPSAAVMAVAREIEKSDYGLGIFLEMKFKAVGDHEVKQWIKNAM